MGYRVFKVLGPALVVLRSTYGKQLFHLARQRKDATCAVCEHVIPKGVRTYRTVNGSTANRMDRVCQSCVDQQHKSEY